MSFLSIASPLTRLNSLYSPMILPFLGQDLDAVVVAVGDDQPALGVELDRVRRPELARPRSRLADGPEELPVPVEHRDASDEIRVLDVRMTLRDVDVAVRHRSRRRSGRSTHSGGLPTTPGVPSVMSTLPSGLNLTTTLPFVFSPGNFLSSVRRRAP